MLQASSTIFWLVLFVKAFAPHVSSAVQPRLYMKGDTEANVNRDGEVIEIAPVQTYDIYCSDTRYGKHWYRVSGQTESSITRLSQPTDTPDVYAINTHGYVLTLQFRPFRSTHAGEYECRFTSHGHTLTPLSVFLSATPPPTVEQRLYTSDASGEVDLENGATLTITPSKTYDIVCSDANYVKHWYRVRGDSSISRYGEYTNEGSTPDVYATNTGGNALSLHFESFHSTDSGEYECRLRPRFGLNLPTVSVFLTPPPPSKVQGVTVNRTVQGSSPALRVSWSAVSGSGITYTVCYSTTSGTQSDPPSNANCSTSGITGTSTTLGALNEAIYYIWVAAVSSGGRGPYSDRRQGNTCNDTALCTMADQEVSNNVGATVAGVLIAILVLVGIIATVTVVGVIFVRKRWPYQIPVVFQVAVRSVHEPGDFKMSSEDLVDSLTEKDSHSSFASANLTDEDLHLYENTEAPSVILKTKLVATTQEMHQNRDRGFEEEFKLIKEYKNGSADVACANRPKNRYGNIYTYDHSRVVLSVPDEDGSDYINASFIDGYNHPNMYIASQGPTGLTMLNFWQMIWDQKCSVLVMLTKVEEKGKKKCERYWPLTVDEPLVVGRGLEVHLRSELEFAYYTVRQLTLNNTSDDPPKPHYLKQFHYTAWPDYGVPSHPSSLVKFVQQVRKEYKNRDRKAPLLTHCSAGVGRTGTFITIDAMLERLQEKDDLNIHQFVTDMRKRRTFMVQTLEQYAFIHDALGDYLTCGDTSVVAHNLQVHIRKLSTRDPSSSVSGFEVEMKLLESVSKKPNSTDEEFSKKGIISRKNRNGNKFLYSNNYLHLSRKSGATGADYINANFIDSYSRNKAFIAAQAPLESTKSDVWEMIWQFRPSAVVVLSNCEDDKGNCCVFWPDEERSTLVFDIVHVSHKNTLTGKDCDTVKVDVVHKRKNDCRVLNLVLYHFKTWPKSGSPPMEPVLQLIGDVGNTLRTDTGPPKPVVVMCDDGMGRSGVFICAMSEVERVKVEGQVDVFQTIKGMRIQRPHMVETPDQYKLCFEILQSYLDSFDTYANFKPV